MLYYKHLMTLQGDAEYALHFNEADALSAASSTSPKRSSKLFEAWYADWRGAKD